MSASHLVNFLHCDLMPRDSAKLAPGSTCFQTDRASACQSWSTGSGAQQTGVVKSLAICNVASAMMRVQRQRRAKYGNKAIGITSAGRRFDVTCSSTSPCLVHPKVLHHHGTDNKQQSHQRTRSTRIGGPRSSHPA